MKRLVLALVSLAMAGSAWAQETRLGWTVANAPQAGVTLAWTVKPPAGANALAQLVIAAREAKPGPAPGTDVRSSRIMTIEVNCAARTVHPLAMTLYNADYVQVSSPTAQDRWAPFAALGNLAFIAEAFCANPNRKIDWQADIMGAQQKLDAALPRPKAPPSPPTTATFEYVGGGDNLQPIQRWLDTASITREGNLARAWVFEVWENAWAWATPPSYNPATWRLYEFECAARPRERNIWFQQFDANLKPSTSTDRSTAQFSVAGDVNIKAAALRACANRPLLFSETIKGDIKTLVSMRYRGAAQKLGAGVAFAPKPAPRPADLGPTIRITEKDAYWSYAGTFTRAGEGSNMYRGQFNTAEGNNPNPTTLFVRGIVDGKLIIDRQGTPQGEFAIPVTNGKPSGKGIASWNRHDDSYSWTLVEPATITVK